MIPHLKTFKSLICTISVYLGTNRSEYFDWNLLTPIALCCVWRTLIYSWQLPFVLTQSLIKVHMLKCALLLLFETAQFFFNKMQRNPLGFFLPNINIFFLFLRYNFSLKLLKPPVFVLLLTQNSSFCIICQ